MQHCSTSIDFLTPHIHSFRSWFTCVQEPKICNLHTFFSSSNLIEEHHDCGFFFWTDKRYVMMIAPTEVVENSRCLKLGFELVDSTLLDWAFEVWQLAFKWQRLCKRRHLHWCFDLLLTCRVALGTRFCPGIQCYSGLSESCSIIRAHRELSQWRPLGRGQRGNTAWSHQMNFCPGVHCAWDSMTIFLLIHPTSLILHGCQEDKTNLLWPGLESDEWGHLQRAGKALERGITSLWG